MYISLWNKEIDYIKSPHTPCVLYWNSHCIQGFLLQWYMSWGGWRNVGSKAECRHDNAEMNPTLHVGWLWCSTCWALEALCLEVVDMMWGFLMSCGPCYCQWDQSWKWTATWWWISATVSLLAARIWHEPIKGRTRWNNRNLLSNVWAKPGLYFTMHHHVLLQYDSNKHSLC